MRSEVSVRRGLAATFVLGLLALSTAIAQVPDEVGAVDKDFGMKLRHAPAYRGELNVPRSNRAEPVEPKLNYRFFDHPKPSFQYFQQPQVIKWSYDMFPGLRQHLYDDPLPPGYYPSYNYYNYCPPCPRYRPVRRYYGW